MAESEPELWRLIREAEWPQVIVRASSHPQEARFRQSSIWHQRSSLQLALEGAAEPPLDAIEALMQADPAADQLVFMACDKGRSISVIKLLLQANPDSIRSKRRCHSLGDLGFNKSCMGTPATYALSHLLEKVHTYSVPPEALEFIQQEPALANVWDTVCLLVRAHCCRSVDESQNISLLRAFCACTKFMDNIDFVRLAIKLYPSQLKERDHEGRLPLHIAAAAESCESPDLFDQHAPTNAIPILIAAYPPAVRLKDSQEKLPIQLALESGKTWQDGLEDLWTAFPTVEVDIEDYVPQDYERPTGDPSLDPLVNCKYRLCFSCTKVKTSAQFCKTHEWPKRTLDRKCIECTIGTNRLPCDCCGHNHMARLTLDTLSHVVSFLPLRDAMKLRKTCRHMNGIGSPYRLCGLRKRELRIIKQQYVRDQRVVNDILANPTAPGHVLKKLLHLAVKGQDLSSIDLLLQSSTCPVDGVLEQAILMHKERAIAVLQDNDRIKETIVKCSYCNENIGALRCRHWDGDGHDSQTCKRDNPRRDRFCLPCARGRFCDVCHRYQCRECDAFEENHDDWPLEADLKFVVENCDSCGQAACKYFSYDSYVQCFWKCEECDELECKDCLETTQGWFACPTCPEDHGKYCPDHSTGTCACQAEDY